MELPYDTAIALLGIYPKDTNLLIQRDTCPPMSIAELSTIAKPWKQTRCPSPYEWIKKMWHIYTHTTSSLSIHHQSVDIWALSIIWLAIVDNAVVNMWVYVPL